LHQHNSKLATSFCRISFNLWLEPTQQQACHRLLKDLLQFLACTNTTASLPQTSEGFVSIYGLNQHNSRLATSPCRISNHFCNFWLAPTQQQLATQVLQDFHKLKIELSQNSKVGLKQNSIKITTLRDS
jgi:hypothetical protein